MICSAIFFILFVFFHLFVVIKSQVQSVESLLPPSYSSIELGEVL